jgi:hypothetical protein
MAILIGFRMGTASATLARFPVWIWPGVSAKDLG